MAVLAMKGSFSKHHNMSDISKEGRMQLAVTAYKNGHFVSKRDCAKAFDVPPSIFMTHQ